MKNNISKVVVLGAGTMGAQVAAHAASKDLEVVLLDMVPKGAQDRTVLAKGMLDRMRKLKPSPYHLPEHRQAILPGNFEDDWKELADADWVFEAVIEDLAIKRGLLGKVQEAIGKDALLTTNTSGLPIASMSEGLDEPLASRFFGTHFFNPPRYLKLLETIPGPMTDPTRLEEFEVFADRVLGKGVVRCKDTRNFIANRIGSYSFGVAMKAMVDMDLSIEAVDTLTGPAIGRARSATFRTGDIAGVDVLAKVAQNLYDAVPDDPERELLLPPAFVGQMLEKGWLGQKSGSGFYRKRGREIEALDWKTLEYRARQKAKYASIQAGKSVADVPTRLRQILAAKDEAADFLWRVLSGTCLYAAAQLPAISDDVPSVDRAMEWGRASVETYMGLVEVGVGVVPGGGGTKEMALRAADRCAGVPDADPFPFLKRAFETIAFAKVSTSGAEALRLYLTPADSLSPNPDRLIRDAKQVSLGLASAGYRPGQPRQDIPVLGTPALATFKMGIHNALRGGQISDHDALVGTKVGEILCGGQRQPGLASEQDLLDLEREAFISLLGTPKTQERIQHTLKTGKPLRN